MLISHKKKFIYLKTKKTASTTVEIYFEPECLNWANHMIASDVKAKIGDDIWDSYFKFCVIRNPFDKLVSYWWWKLGAKNSQDLETRDFVEIKRHFNFFIQNLHNLVLDRDIYMINKEVCIDFFIRYENLTEDISQVCRLLDINFDSSKIGKYKSSFRKTKIDFHDYYNEESKNIVKQAYAWEIDKFNYSFK